MSGFNTKEKNNYGEYEIAFYTDNHEDFKKVQDLCRELIDHDKPVSTEGDLISRSALKKAIIELNLDNTSHWSVIHKINNAPTVDIKDEIAGAYNEGYMCGSREAEKARPQGEWIIDQEGDKNTITLVTCPFCGERHCCKMNFCGNCGADLKGGAE